MTRHTAEELAELFMSKKTFTLNEVAALWTGELPPKIWIDDPRHPEYNPNNLPTKSFNNPRVFELRLETLQEAVGDGKEKHKDALKVKTFHPSIDYDETGEPIGHIDNTPCPENTTVNRCELERWAEAQGFDLPFLCQSANKERLHKKIITAVFDNNNDQHSIELAIALKAWHHFYYKNKINPNLGEHKNQIETWIRETFPLDIRNNAITEKAVARISTMVNRYKKVKYKDFKSSR